MCWLLTLKEGVVLPSSGREPWSLMTSDWWHQIVCWWHLAVLPKFKLHLYNKPAPALKCITTGDRKHPTSEVHHPTIEHVQVETDRKIWLTIQDEYTHNTLSTVQQHVKTSKYSDFWWSQTLSVLWSASLSVWWKQIIFKTMRSFTLSLHRQTWWVIILQELHRTASPLLQQDYI